MFDLTTIGTIGLTFVLAGMVKGVIGLGLPTVTLALLTVAIDLPTAMALLLIPSFVTNVWQAAVGGNGVILLKRLWPFLTVATMTVGVGGYLMQRTQLPLLSALLGGLLVAYAVISLTGRRFDISDRRENLSGVTFGAVNGVLTGLTGSFVVPGVMFLQGLGLQRDALVQAMGMLFTVSTIALAATMHTHQMLSGIYIGISTAAVLPSILGMVVGQRLRQRLSEQAFRRVFFWSVLLVGTFIVVKATSASYA